MTTPAPIAPQAVVTGLVNAVQGPLLEAMQKVLIVVVPFVVALFVMALVWAYLTGRFETRRHRGRRGRRAAREFAGPYDDGLNLDERDLL